MSPEVAMEFMYEYDKYHTEQDRSKRIYTIPPDVYQGLLDISHNIYMPFDPQAHIKTFMGVPIKIDDDL